MIWRRLLLTLSILFICSSVFGATEDFTTYEENDPDGDITINSSTKITTISPNSGAYVRKDFGSGHFGNFEHLVKVAFGYPANGTISAVGWTVNNGETSRSEMGTNNKGITWYFDRGTDGFYIIDYTNDNSDVQLGGFWATTRYLTLERNGTTFTAKIYTDSSRTTLDDTLSITCGADTYRYIYVVFNNTDGSGTHTIENLDLQETAAPPSGGTTRRRIMLF